MNKLNLNSENTNTIYFRGSSQITCTCYGCADCLACLVFAPLSAVIIFVTLGITLNMTKNK